MSRFWWKFNFSKACLSSAVFNISSKKNKNVITTKSHNFDYATLVKYFLLLLSFFDTFFVNKRNFIIFSYAFSSVFKTERAEGYIICFLLNNIALSFLYIYINRCLRAFFSFFLFTNERACCAKKKKKSQKLCATEGNENKKKLMFRSFFFSFCALQSDQLKTTEY